MTFRHKQLNNKKNNNDDTQTLIRLARSSAHTRSLTDTSFCPCGWRFLRLWGSQSIRTQRQITLKNPGHLVSRTEFGETLGHKALKLTTPGRMGSLCMQSQLNCGYAADIVIFIAASPSPAFGSRRLASFCTNMQTLPRGVAGLWSQISILYTTACLGIAPRNAHKAPLICCCVSYCLNIMMHNCCSYKVQCDLQYSTVQRSLQHLDVFGAIEWILWGSSARLSIGA